MDFIKLDLKTYLEWNAGTVKAKSSKSYELLENENDDDLHSDSISIHSFDGPSGLVRNTHKRQPSNGLDSISVQTI